MNRILIFLFIFFSVLDGYGQDFCYTRGDLTCSEKHEIQKLLADFQQKGTKAYIKHLKTDDLVKYSRLVLLYDGDIKEISLKDSLLTLVYDPEFYNWSSMSEVWFVYQDIYSCFFSFPQVNRVSVLLSDGTNITFMPTELEDYWIAVEDAIMYRKNFVEGLDYGVLLGLAAEYIEEHYRLKSNGDLVGEFRNDILTKKIEEFLGEQCQ